MSEEIKVPNLGESVTEAELIRWIKEDGAVVKEDEPIAEIETDKASVEINAPKAGVLKHRVSAPSDVEVGTVVAEVAEGGQGKTQSSPNKDKEEPSDKKSADSANTGSAQEGQRAKAAPTEDKPVQDSKEDQAATSSSSSEEMDEEDQKVLYRLSPSLRKLVREKDIDPSKIEGTGPGGRILESDVERAGTPAKSTASTPAPVSRGEVDLVPMTRIRKTIARRLVQAQHEAAMLTTFNEIDMHEVMELRKQYKESFEKKYEVGLGFMSFFAKAVVIALKEYPVVNASIEGENIRYTQGVHLGVAVSTERGLMVPVLRNTDKMSFAEIESRIKEVARAARDGKLGLDELSGGTFTITNGGVFGSMMSTPILNRPQSGILGLHAIQKRAKVMPNDEIKARPMMYVALSYDHRLVDGRESVSFLVRIKELIEDPSRLLLDV